MRTRTIILTALLSLLVGKQAVGQFVPLPNNPFAGVAEWSYGAACADYDNDGHVDIFVANYDMGKPNRLYRGQGDGTFVEVTGQPIVTDQADSLGACWGDYDNDGDTDIFVCNYGLSFLYENDGAGAFSRVTIGGLGNFSGTTRSASWRDFDLDGDLDIAIAQAQGLTVLRNDGSAVFTQQYFAPGDYLGCAWGDYDADGNPDLIGFQNGANHVARNLGGGVFASTPLGPVTTDPGNSSSGGWVDVDNDGDLDLVVINVGASVDRLYENIGGGTFVSASAGALTSGLGGGNGIGWMDVDQDGDIDLVTGGDGGVNSPLFLNDGTGVFSITAVAPPGGGHQGVAFGDFDEDGRFDLVFARGVNVENRAFLNRWPQQSHITLQCEGTLSPRDGTGAQVVVTALLGGSTPTTQTRVIEGGVGFGSYSEPLAHFGLGSGMTAMTLTIHWPSGTTDAYSNIDAGRWRAIEGNGLMRLDGVGQANSALARLEVNGTGTGSTSGPFISLIQLGHSLSFDLYGTPNSFYEMYGSNTLNPAGWNFGGFGLFDLGTGPSFADVFILLPGFQGTFPFYALDGLGESHLSFYVHPSLTPGPVVSVQALIQNPQPWTPDPVTGIPLWGTLTAAHTLVVQ